MKRLALLVLCALLIAACSDRTTKTVDLKKHFGPYAETGTFKLWDLTKEVAIAYSEEPPDKRYTPASTFKVPHALIALQTGVLKDEHTLMKWDGKIHSTPGWNKDQTLGTALQESVVWAFQDLARELGRGREQEWLDKIGYGNRKIGDTLETFWLDGSLQISVDEQLTFMTRLYREELPFDPKVMQTVKRLITTQRNDGVILAAKTGTALRVQPNVGWYVGYVVVKEKPYTFVTRIHGDGASAVKAKEITEAVLKELKLLP